MRTSSFLGRLALVVLLALSGCTRPAATITLATTTSTRDTGLLDDLLPVFRQKTGIQVNVVAVGSGQALELGRRGDADVLLVHDPAGEERFMAEGHGLSRKAVMHNDFVLLGPEQERDKLGARPVVEALGQIARGQVPFVSRGDESGTHAKEKALWKAAGVVPKGDWYIQAGSGMAEVLRMADQKRACTLSDRGTFLALRDKLGLVILSEGGRELANPYHVIVVDPAKHPAVRSGPAGQLAEFLVSPEARQRIAEFGKDRFGQPLFFVDEGEPQR